MFAEWSHMHQVLYESSFKLPCHYRGFFGSKDYVNPASQFLEDVLMVQREEGRLSRMGVEAKSWVIEEPQPVRYPNQSVQCMYVLFPNSFLTCPVHMFIWCSGRKKWWGSWKPLFSMLQLDLMTCNDFSKLVHFPIQHVLTNAPWCKL